MKNIPFNTNNGGWSFQKEFQRITKPMNVLYVATYIPRRCGIATFTKDLTNAINMFNPSCLAQIVALDDPSQNIDYPKEVKFKINYKQWSSYQKVVNRINKSSEFDLLCLQHEFGIFGGEHGNYAVRFIEKINKPVVTTLHTVLSQPSPEVREVLNRICQKSIFVIVMLQGAVDILVKQYGVPEEKIMVILHGVPDFPKLNTDEWKKRLNLRKKIVMSSINLLSETKGVDYAIQSLSQVIKKIPNFIYLVVGQTHPELLRVGKVDNYRLHLEKLVEKLKLKKHVKFINNYVSRDELISIIGASDYYITPYLDPEQIASGALSYAIGAGKLCISTPYLYANEMLSQDRGIIVPFRNSHKIAQAINNLNRYQNKKKSIEHRAYKLGRNMTWVNIAHQYFHLFYFAVNKHYYKIPKNINLRNHRETPNYLNTK